MLLAGGSAVDLKMQVRAAGCACQADDADDPPGLDGFPFFHGHGSQVGVDGEECALKKVVLDDDVEPEAFIRCHSLHAASADGCDRRSQC